MRQIVRIYFGEAGSFNVDCRNQALPSRPGEFHPEPLTDPDVRLSPHPARATLKKAAASHQDKEFLRLSVDSIPMWMTCSLRSTGVTPLPHYYEAVRPWPVHRYF